jgi:hypothetical protein
MKPQEKNTQTLRGYPQRPEPLEESENKSCLITKGAGNLQKSGRG